MYLPLSSRTFYTIYWSIGQSKFLMEKISRSFCTTHNLVCNTKWIFFRQLDLHFCSNSSHKLNDFLKYGYIGVLRNSRFKISAKVQNGGFSVKTRSKLLELCFFVHGMNTLGFLDLFIWLTLVLHQSISRWHLQQRQYFTQARWLYTSESIWTLKDWKLCTKIAQIDGWFHHFVRDKNRMIMKNWEPAGKAIYIKDHRMPTNEAFTVSHCYLYQFLTLLVLTADARSAHA
jgi:hypothetical protein